ncbi:MAG: hypothetical protein ACR2OU_15615 [Thermomicrobiales bacterium]
MRSPQGLASGLLVALLGCLAFTSSSALAQTSVDLGITLAAPEVLTAMPCSIRVATGHTVTGDLNDCVTGGQGVRHFGPSGGPISAPDGGTITIDDSGTFTYSAGPDPLMTTFPFTATDGSLTSNVPIPGVVDVTVYAGLQASSPIFHVTPGAVITGNLNDYVTGGFGTRHFGPVGTGMPTLGGGTITIEADGSFTYVAPGFDRDDSFPFTVIDDSTANPIPGTVFIEVRGDSAVTPTPSPVASHNGHSDRVDGDTSGHQGQDHDPADNRFGYDQRDPSHDARRGPVRHAVAPGCYDRTWGIMPASLRATSPLNTPPPVIAATTTSNRSSSYGWV